MSSVAHFPKIDRILQDRRKWMYMNWRPILIIPPIIVGLGIYYFMTQSDSSVETAPPPEYVTPVRVTELHLTSYTGTISGFGRMAAESTWKAISQVDGRVIETAPLLSVGQVIPAGTVLVRIDPRSYEIAMAKAEANLASAVSQLEEIDAKEINTKALLALESDIEDFLRTDFDRKEALVKKKSLAQASLDKSNRELLTQQRKVLELRNTLSLFPVQRVSLQASIETRQAELEEAERNLSNTTIVAPMTGRVTEESLAVGQYVRPGDQLVILEGTNASEVVAEFQPSALSRLMEPIVPDGKIIPTIAQSSEKVASLMKQLGLTVVVKAKFGDQDFDWPAEVVRIRGRADSTTGALGIVVRVKNAGRPDPVRRRPPLYNGTFVEIVLSAPELTGLLIPRTAVHIDEDGGRFVYVLDQDDRLQRKNITPGSTVGAAIIVRDGLEPGQKLILSDPQPAVLGMKLSPIPQTPKGDGAFSAPAGQ